MNTILTIRDRSYKIDLDQPLSIGIPLNPFELNPACFYADQPSAKPMIFNNYVCSMEAGAPVNFYTLNIVPHGNGTHTECVGHISPNFEKVNQIIKNPFFLTELITLKPQVVKQDHVITAEMLSEQIQHKTDTLIIRTLPNTPNKKQNNYTETNPPYVTPDAMTYIVANGYKHLLLDLPSVDKEKDDGAMISHKIFWNTNDTPDKYKTITELIYVDNKIKDGLYIMNLQISNIVLDAVPSNPILYDIIG